MLKPMPQTIEQKTTLGDHDRSLCLEEANLWNKGAICSLHFDTLTYQTEFKNKIRS